MYMYHPTNSYFLILLMSVEVFWWKKKKKRDGDLSVFSLKVVGNDIIPDSIF